MLYLASSKCFFSLKSVVGKWSKSTFIMTRIEKHRNPCVFIYVTLILCLCCFICKVGKYFFVEFLFLYKPIQGEEYYCFQHLLGCQMPALLLILPPPRPPRPYGHSFKKRLKVLDKGWEMPQAPHCTMRLLGTILPAGKSQ